MSIKSRRMYRSVSLLVCLMVVAITQAAPNAQSADYGGYRPHYQGYGVDTPGGRGGVVCKVTSVSDTAWPPAQGTLRYCVETLTGPRIVIFETSGTIRLVQGELVITSPYITIAGQTAPSPGILIRNQGLVVDTHDVVVQHIRVRVGNVGGLPHGLWVRDDADDIVFDHVSVSWAIWNGVTVHGTRSSPGEVTLIDSIVSETLGCSGVNEGAPCDPNNYPGSGWANSRGMLIAPSSSVTVLRNIFANLNDRMPETGGSTSTFIVNNLVFNPSLAASPGIGFSNPLNWGATRSVVVGNVLVPGATTPFHNGYIPPDTRRKAARRW